MSTPRDAISNTRLGPRVWGSAATFLFVYMATRFIIKFADLPSAAKIAVALLPVASFAWLALEWIGAIRNLDEMQRRIQLEALAFAFPVFMTIMMLLGMLQLVMVLPEGDLSYRHVWGLMPLLYFIGLVMAERRYR